MIASKRVWEEIRTKVLATPLQDIQNHLSKYFYQAEEVVAALYYSIISEGNIILYGPGGFGKTEITKAFFEFFDIPTSVLVGHAGLEVEALLGIPNIKKLMDDSEYEVAFEKSIFATEGVLILEEFLDVRSSVATALKDIITAGGYRRGEEFIESKIGPIVICTNKSPNEVSIDASTHAFYKERFPFSMRVIWDSFSTDDYLKLFALKNDDFIPNRQGYELIAELCASSYVNDIVISPRIGLKAADLLKRSGSVDTLKMVEGLDTSKMSEIVDRLEIRRQEQELLPLFNQFKNKIRELDFKKVDKSVKMLHIMADLRASLIESNIQSEEVLRDVSALLQEFSILEVDIKAWLDEYSETGSKSLGKLNEIYEDIQDKIPDPK